MDNNLKYVARIVIETTSGFAVNSGDKSLLLDNQIARDANGLPYIPGTTIAGIIQHHCLANGLSNPVGSLFGCTETDAKDKGFDQAKGNENGSRLIFTSAHLVGQDGQTVIDGLTVFKEEEEYYQKMLYLPQRDHVRITDRGAADVVQHGKFDREVVYKGTRFCFEIELVGTESDKKDFQSILRLLQSDAVRIGSGTRKGAGSFRVLSSQSRYWIVDLTNPSDLTDYLHKSSNLNSQLNKNHERFPNNGMKSDQWKDYSINLSPEDFFLFGTSLPDKDADNTPKTETIIEWENNSPQFRSMYLFPASSIKGALRHRTAFYYNLATNQYIGNQKSISAEDLNWDISNVLEDELPVPDTQNWTADGPEWDKKISEIEALDFDTFIDQSKGWTQFLDSTNDYATQPSSYPIGEDNEAVRELFGTALETNVDKGQIGRIIIDDIYQPLDHFETKIFNHVKIDRFTGGAFDGALFQEKALYSNKVFSVRIMVNVEGLDKKYQAAFEKAHSDLKEGNLALGAATTKGYGVFISQNGNS